MTFSHKKSTILKYSSKYSNMKALDLALDRAVTDHSSHNQATKVSSLGGGGEAEINM
jgi:hypothetical protein